MRVHYLQHASFETPGTVVEWARTRGHEIRGTSLWCGEALPETGDFDLLLVMGGPMSVNDEAEYPWLVPEKRLVERTLAENTPVVGICLGSQILANVLGSRIYKNHAKEIGWFPVRLTEHAQDSPLFEGVPQEMVAFHWHGETYDVPSAARHLAVSKGCRSQAFECGSALGLQFHLETDSALLDGMLAHCAGDIGDGPYEQSAEAIRAGSAQMAAMKSMLFGILDRLTLRWRTEL